MQKVCKSCLNIQCVISASQQHKTELQKLQFLNQTVKNKQGTNSSKWMKCQAAQRNRKILKVQQIKGLIKIGYYTTLAAADTFIQSKFIIRNIISLSHVKLCHISSRPICISAQKSSCKLLTQLSLHISLRQKTLIIHHNQHSSSITLTATPSLYLMETLLDIHMDKRHKQAYTRTVVIYCDAAPQ